MANPTGSQYLAANLGYVWTDGDVYEIPQTDQLEGAATGASFSGIGVVNQPHQVLLNKVQATRRRQLTDEANIDVLLAFMALFTSGSNGYGYWRTTPSQDQTLGLIKVYEQWGKRLGILPDTVVTQTWPVAFPNRCLWVEAVLSNPSLAPFEQDNTFTIEVGQFNTTTGWFYINLDIAPPGGLTNADGFFWRAVGY
jgi:hypothetical protein